MKLQKQLSRKTEGIEYAKWVIVVPPTTVKKLGWKEGAELDTEVKKNRLVIMPAEKKEKIQPSAKRSSR